MKSLNGKLVSDILFNFETIVFVFALKNEKKKK